jgi:hypothetical protein
VRLADGTFEVGDELDDWKDYGVRRATATAATAARGASGATLRAFRTDDGSTAWFAARR